MAGSELAQRFASQWITLIEFMKETTVDYNYNYKENQYGCHVPSITIISVIDTTTTMTIMIVATTLASATALFKHHNKLIDAILRYTDPRKRNYFCCNCDTHSLVAWCIILIASHDEYQNIYHFVVCLYSMHVSLKLDNQFDPYPSYNMRIYCLDLVDSIIEILYDYAYLAVYNSHHDDIDILIQSLRLIDDHLYHIYNGFQQISLVIKFHLFLTLLMEIHYLLWIYIYIYFNTYILYYIDIMKVQTGCKYNGYKYQHTFSRINFEIYIVICQTTNTININIDPG